MIEQFIQNQTLTNYQILVNVGIKLKELKNGNWVSKSEFTLPIAKDRLIILYDKNPVGLFEPTGIGIF